MNIPELPDEVLNDFIQQATRSEREAMVLTLFALNEAKRKHPTWPVKKGLAYNSKAQDYTLAAAVVAEEAGELLKAAMDYQYHGKQYFIIRGEAMQTAAMGIRFISNLPEIE